jgi:predicted glycosyltransferase
VKVLIDIGHPGHVHLFKNFAKTFQERGHSVLFTVREKEFECELLRSFDLKYILLGKNFTSLAGKIFGILKFDINLLRVALKFKPDIFFSHGSMYAAHVATVLGKPHISMEDSGNMEQIRLYRPFTKAILTPDILKEELGSKQIRYKGYHEISYLHPNYFTPDINVKRLLGLKDTDRFCIVRFVSWNATHDLGKTGLTPKEKIGFVNELSKSLTVFITSEKELPDEIKRYQIRLSPHLIHHALAFAEVTVSEGATITSESGVLGTPAIYVSSIARSYIDDQEKYGTVYNCHPGNGAILKIRKVLEEGKLCFKERREKLISDKIDVTAFMVWFIENYPQSFRVMKNDPNYQLKFKQDLKGVLAGAKPC